MDRVALPNEAETMKAVQALLPRMTDILRCRCGWQGVKSRVYQDGVMTFECPECGNKPILEVVLLDYDPTMPVAKVKPFIWKDEHAFKRVYKKGYSDRRIGRAFGVNKDTVRNRRKKLGLPPNHPKAVAHKWRGETP